MKLLTWMRRNSHTYKSFAAEIGCHYTAVGHWVNGRVPEDRFILKIWDVTGGQVTPCSFYGLRCPCEIAAEEAEARRRAEERAA